MNTLKAYYRRLNGRREGFLYQQSCVITVLCLILSLFASNINVYSHSLPLHPHDSSTGKHRLFSPTFYGNPVNVWSDSPGTLEVAWSGVGDFRQPAKSHYELHVKSAGHPWYFGTNPNFSSYTVDVNSRYKKFTNLVAGASYDVRVRAHPSSTGHWMESNWAGGSGTVQSNVTPPPPSKPDAPTINSVSASSDTALSVSWTAGASNGASIAGFRIEWRVSGSSESYAGSDAGASETEAAITGLQPNTTYEVRVRTRVTTGVPSDWSTSTGTTSPSGPPPSSKPDAPTINSVSASSDTALSVSWTEGSDNGASVTGFRIEGRVSGSGGSWLGANAGSSATQATITGLRPGTTYEIRIQTRVASPDVHSNWAYSTGTTTGEQEEDDTETETTTETEDDGTETETTTEDEEQQNEETNGS